MSINGEWDLRANYDRFNRDDINGFMALFAPDAVYRQLDTGRIATGRDQIRGMLASWDVFFEGAAITDVRVKSTPWLAEQQPDASTCYRVVYIGTGRYVRTLSGLADAAPAHGKKVSVPTKEIVWFDLVGKIVRVDQSLSIAALQ